MTDLIFTTCSQINKVLIRSEPGHQSHVCQTSCSSVVKLSEQHRLINTAPEPTWSQLGQKRSWTRSQKIWSYWRLQFWFWFSSVSCSTVFDLYSCFVSSQWEQRRRTTNMMSRWERRAAAAVGLAGAGGSNIPWCSLCLGMEKHQSVGFYDQLFHRVSLS